MTISSDEMLNRVKAKVLDAAASASADTALALVSLTTENADHLRSLVNTVHGAVTGDETLRIQLKAMASLDTFRANAGSYLAQKEWADAIIDTAKELVADIGSEVLQLGAQEAIKFLANSLAFSGD